MIQKIMPAGKKATKRQFTRLKNFVLPRPKDFKHVISLVAAAIAQGNRRQRIPFCGPGFESQA